MLVIIFLLYTKRIEKLSVSISYFFYFKMFLTYVNTIEYVYFASSYYIYIFIHANMVHQQPSSFHYY